MSNSYRSPKTIGGALFGTGPVARNTDPDTSHAAAESVRHIRESQEAVLSVLRDSQDGMTDSDLLEAYYRKLDWRTPAQSDSGIRTRRAELVKQGLVVDSGRRVTLPSGRQSIVWRVA